MWPIRRLGRSVIWTTMLLTGLGKGLAETPTLITTPVAAYQMDSPDLSKFSASAWSVTCMSNAVKAQVLLCRMNLVVPYDITRRKAGRALRLDQHCKRSAALLPDGERFVTCDAGVEVTGRYIPGGSIKLWSIKKKSKPRAVARLQGPGPIGVTDDGKNLLHWSGTKPLSLVEIDSGNVTPLNPRVHCAGWSSNVAFAAAQFVEVHPKENIWKVSIFDVKNAREVASWIEKFGDLTSMAVSRDGNTLAVAIQRRLPELGTSPRDGDVRVVEAATGKHLVTFAAEASEKLGIIRDLKMSDSGKLIAATTESGIMVCDVAQRKRIATLNEKKGSASCCWTTTRRLPASTKTETSRSGNCRPLTASKCRIRDAQSMPPS